MTYGIRRLTSLATVVALLLALVAVAPAAAADGATRYKGAEKYALSLLNCTRTGGWVRADGSCAGRGSGKYSAYRKPLRLHKGISRKVAWPWARALVVNNVCGHTIAGKPSLSTRMRTSGFRYWSYGENVGCGWGTSDVKAVVLATHRAMQAEKAARGGHWKNMKNRSFKSVGIGVAHGSGRTMIVYDFYGKRY
ncbi:MAG: CAP domain-containing protein [Chloroflexota bacterium]|jgi:hypothetical protein